MTLLQELTVTKLWRGGFILRGRAAGTCGRLPAKDTSIGRHVKDHLCLTCHMHPGIVWACTDYVSYVDSGVTICETPPFSIAFLTYLA